jgi:hypothetical protein
VFILLHFLQAYERLYELARTLGLEADYEMIPPPGLVDLNRDNLVVICGPACLRSSPRCWPATPTSASPG